MSGSLAGSMGLNVWRWKSIVGFWVPPPIISFSFGLPPVGSFCIFLDWQSWHSLAVTHKRPALYWLSPINHMFYNTEYSFCVDWIVSHWCPQLHIAGSTMKEEFITLFIFLRQVCNYWRKTTVMTVNDRAKELDYSQSCITHKRCTKRLNPVNRKIDDSKINDDFTVSKWGTHVTTIFCGVNELEKNLSKWTKVKTVR